MYHLKEKGEEYKVDESVDKNEGNGLPREGSVRAKIVDSGPTLKQIYHFHSLGIEISSDTNNEVGEKLRKFLDLEIVH